MTPPMRTRLVPVDIATLRQRFKAPILLAGALGLVALLVWLASGIYTVNPGEQGVIRRFGKMVGVRGSGLRYHLPYPIERVDIVNVEAVRRIEVGFRADPTYHPVPLESLMLTHDQNMNS